jgi:hypothetical protein
MSLFFLHLLSNNHKSTHPCCNAAQKMKSASMKTSSRHAGPSQLPMVWCFVLLLGPLGLVIRLNVINTGYTVYFTICRFMCETSSWYTQRYAFSFGLETGCDS